MRGSFKDILHDQPYLVERPKPQPWEGHDNTADANGLNGIDAIVLEVSDLCVRDQEGQGELEPSGLFFQLPHEKVQKMGHAMLFAAL